LGARRAAVNGAEQHEHAVAGAFEHRHLAELGVVVHTRMGARVAGEDRAFVEFDANAVRHGVEWWVACGVEFEADPTAVLRRDRQVNQRQLSARYANG